MTEGTAQAMGEADAESPPPSFEHLCLNLPLYATVETTNREFLKELRYGDVQIDAFCVGCNKESTFKTVRNRGSSGSGSFVSPDWMLAAGHIRFSLHCQRAKHHYVYEFYYDGRILIKYGQLPSMEDISGADIVKFRGVLGSGYFAELRRATGLASHGIGIGAFVYLRRIFEHLIKDHHVAQANAGKAVEDFDKLRMDQKIEALRDVLPPALVRNKATYSILSGGIHALDENACRKYFPVVKAAIIEILEQDLRAREADKAAATLEAAIATLAGEVKAITAPTAD